MRALFLFPEGFMKIHDTVKKIDEYTERNRDGLPILEECCLENNWDFDELTALLSQNPKIKSAISRLFMRKRVNLEKFGLTGAFSKPMSIFLLERLYAEKSEESRFQALKNLDLLLKADEDEANALPGDE
jgi:hypothetical protein